MVVRLANNWWAVAIRGVAATIFGVFAIASPMKTLFVLVLWFAAFALVDGVFALIAALFHRGNPATPWWSLLLEGVLGILAGLVAAINPNAAEEILVYFVAGWAVITGIAEILMAIRVREHIQGEWALALAGVVSIAFGVLVAFRPAVGAIYLAWMIGIYALIFGGMMISLSLRLRRFAIHHHQSGSKP